LSGAFPPFLDGLSFEPIHDEERGTVLGHVVVHDDDCTGMLDAVRGIAFPQEPRADVRSAGSAPDA
jgi:hypothetical protein